MMEKSLSRRSFVKASAATAGGAAAASMLAACGGAGAADSGSKKKVLRFAQSNAKQGLDMQKSTNSGSSSIADCIFESPLRWTEDNELVPCLLKEIPTFEADGVTLHCELKPNIKFHDGTTLTASDVKYSFERMFKPETGGKSTYMYDLIKGAKEMLAGTATELEGLTVEDDTHFTFVLTNPMVTFVNNLGINYADIFPKDACEKAGKSWGTGTNCIGTGKYKVVSNDDTTEVVFARFDDYHDGKPALDEVHFQFVDDLNTKMMSFKNGDVDYCDLDASQLQQYKSDPAVKDLITQYPTLGVQFVNLNLSSEKLQDVRVRKALSLAINRDELIQSIVGGAGTVPSGWLAPQTPGHDPNAPAFEYDPEKAKALLAEAGVTNLELSAKVRANINQKQLVAVQDYWSKIGVKLTVETEDYAQATCAGDTTDTVRAANIVLRADDFSRITSDVILKHYNYELASSDFSRIVLAGMDLMESSEANNWGELHLSTHINDKGKVYRGRMTAGGIVLKTDYPEDDDLTSRVEVDATDRAVDFARDLSTELKRNSKKGTRHPWGTELDFAWGWHNWGDQIGNGFSGVEGTAEAVTNFRNLQLAINVPVINTTGFALKAGIGIQWDKFRFATPEVLYDQSTDPNGFAAGTWGESVATTSLKARSVMLPIKFEFGNRNRWHFSITAMPGFAWTGKNTGLRRHYNEVEATFDEHTDKDYSINSHFNPYRLDVRAAVQYGGIGFYVQAATLPLLKDDSQKLYPIMFGIIL